MIDENKGETKELIGYSLSLCVQDMIEKDINSWDVEKIITGTRCTTKEDWEYVIRLYRRVFWKKNPECGESIAWTLYAEGKLEQPRIEGRQPPDIHGVGSKYIWNRKPERK